MTQQTRAANKAKFETGDAPTESDYIDLIDSFLSLADTSAQTVTSPVTFSNAVAIGGELSAASVSANSISITTNVSASGARFTTGRIGTLTVSGRVSASAGAFNELTLGGQQILAPGDAAGAEIYITATASTAIASAFTWYAIDVSGVVSAKDVVLFDASSDGTITYTGTDERRILIQVIIAAQRGAANDIVAGLAVQRNGTIIPGVEQERSFTSNNIGSFSCITIVSASANDEFRVAISNMVPDSPGSALAPVLAHKLNFVVTQL